MPDKKLTDNEIVKALRSWLEEIRKARQAYLEKVNEEHYPSMRYEYLLSDTIHEINRLQRENKNYSQNNQTMTKDVLELQKENAGLKMTNEILSTNADTAFQDGLNEAQELYAEQIKVEIKAETYKEFAEWLYSLFPTENSEIVVISRTGIAKKVNELLGKRSD